MSRKLLSLSMILLGACTAGPNSPYEYQLPSVTVNVRLLDVPTGASQAQVTAYFIKRTNDQQSFSPGGTLTRASAAWATAPLQAGAIPFELTAEFAGLGGQSPTWYPNLRFFSLDASFSSEPPETSTGVMNIYSGWGQPGLLLVYAVQPTAWTLFGPGSPTVTFPQGYSWLHRTCGTVPGQIQLDVRPIEEVVELRPLGSDSGSGMPSYGHTSEESFVASCGGGSVAVDPGTRLSFDRAGSLAWSPDNTILYYLSVGDSDAPTMLRQIRLTDLVSSELASVPTAVGLQVDGRGALYVYNPDHLLRAPSPVTPPVTLTTLPVPATASVSPDGRWLSYDSHIWDVQAGTNLATIAGTNATWSPDSQLAYWSFSGVATSTSLSTIAPGELGFASPRTYPLTANLPTPHVAWTSEGPVVAETPFEYPPSEWYRSCGGCFGLSLFDAATGIERAVLDGSVGRVDPLPIPPVLGFLFVRTTNCLGLYDTVCSYSLLRVNLTTATAETIATSTKIVPMAVSSDGHRVALSRSDGIYVKDLP